MQGADPGKHASGLAPGQVAQLVEQRTENPCVGGSIPPLSTSPKLNDASGLRHWLFSFLAAVFGI